METTAIAEVRAMLEGVLAGLPTGSARLSEETTTSGLTCLRITPAVHAAAPIAIALEAGVGRAYVHLGRAISVELDAKGPNFTGAPWLEELRQICTAVMSGRFEETTWMSGKRILKAHGQVHLETTTLRLRYSRLLSLLHRGTKVHTKYFPYTASEVGSMG